MSSLVFDIGGTNMRSAFVVADGFVGIEHTKTPKDPREAVRILSERGAVDVAVGGIAGIITLHGDVTNATNLPSWNEFPFDTELEKALNAPVTVVNDAELAALGEATYGAGSGYARVAYIGLGTGVGTALVVQGVIEPGTSNGEGRAGVMTLSDGTWLEDYVGGRALTQKYQTEPKDLPRNVWDELTPALAQTITSMLAKWEPTAVVLCGSLMNEENGFRMEDVKGAVGKTDVAILRGTLKDEAGLWGARAFAEKM